MFSLTGAVDTLRPKESCIVKASYLSCTNLMIRPQARIRVKLGSNPILVNPKSHFQPGRLASLQLSTSPSVFPFLRQATALGSRHIHDIIMSAKDDEYFLRKTSSIILGDIAQMHLVS